MKEKRFFQPTFLSVPPGSRLIYATDLEGDLSALFAFCQNSAREGLPGLHLLSNDKTIDDLKSVDWSRLRLGLDENCYFVFGGDATDHAVGDITILHLLVSLKKEYPDRVVLISGNRDINKVRYFQEFSEPFIDSIFSLDEHAPPEPRWLPMERRWSLKRYIREGMTEALKEAFDGETPDSIIKNWKSFPLRGKQLIYLNWMLSKSLNSPMCFDNRRRELENQKLPNDIDSVLNSFQLEKDIRNEYLKLSTLGVIINNNVTVVHGGLVPETFISTLLHASKREYLPVSFKTLTFRAWVQLSEKERAKKVEEYLYSLDVFSDENCIQIRDYVFEHMNQSFQQALGEAFQPVSLQPDPEDGGLIAKGFINQQTLPTGCGFVGYSDINKEGDVLIDSRWENFLFRAKCVDNISGHIPQGDHGRVLSGKVRFILIDTTFKKQLPGIPNEDLLEVIFDTQQGHTIRIINSVESHEYPRMDKKGIYKHTHAFKNTFFYLDSDWLPDKYKDKPLIYDFPWSLGPRVFRQGRWVTLLTQKHGVSGGFKTYVIELEDKQLEALRQALESDASAG